jgi:UDP:flavonoid glycosyltransferase YjiC (YdhE family)
MRITVIALGSRGDIQPYASLGQGLQTAGHQVHFVTTQGFEALIGAHGLTFHPIPGDAQETVQTAGASMLSLAQAFGELSMAITRDSAWLESIVERSDLILNQLPGGLYGYDLAEKYGVPMALTSVIPMTRTSAFPMIGWPTLAAALPGYSKLTFLLSEQAMWQMFRRVINRWRARTLDLPKSPLLGHLGELYARRVVVLNGFSRHVVPPPPDWGEQVRTVGYWWPEDEEWQPSDELLRFLEGGERPVFVGFGSMPLRDPERATTLVLEATAKTGQRVILHGGWGGLGDGPLPEHAYRIEYAPYDWLFRRMSAVVHHGGSGTTALALRSGVPSLVVPFLFDQFFWGRRVAELGVGPEPVPYRRLAVGRLAEAINEAVGDGEMRRRAGMLGAKLRSEDGVAGAVEVVEGMG